MTSEAQKKAIKKYLSEKTTLIQMRVAPEVKARIQAEAAALDMSTTQYILSCIEEAKKIRGK